MKIVMSEIAFVQIIFLDISYTAQKNNMIHNCVLFYIESFQMNFQTLFSTIFSFKKAFQIEKYNKMRCHLDDTH